MGFGCHIYRISLEPKVIFAFWGPIPLVEVEIEGRAMANE